MRFTWRPEAVRSPSGIVAGIPYTRRYTVEHISLAVILAYLAGLMVLNFYVARRVKSSDDFLLAGRSLGVNKMVFTLICTWIGSGSFIAGAEYASRAGWSSMWLPAGAWIGILLIYFLAARIRSFGKYTIGDILEVRYGPVSRLLAAVTLVVAFTTIVAYQFLAGGFILNITAGIPEPQGITYTALFVIGFTALGGMMAVAHTDLPNGVVIVTASLLSLPLVIIGAGGLSAPVQQLPPTHFQVFAGDFGKYPALKAGGYMLSTLLLLMGVQSMYQKFYSAKTPQDAKKAVALWVMGTVVVETVIIAIAIFGASRHWPELQTFDAHQKLKKEVATLVSENRLAWSDPQTMKKVLQQKLQHILDDETATGKLRRDQEVMALLTWKRSLDAQAFASPEAFQQSSAGLSGRAIVLQSADDLVRGGGLGLLIGFLLLAAAAAVVLSTGMNYLFSPSSNLIHDIVQRFISPDLSDKWVVILQKIFVVLLGLVAYLVVWIPTANGEVVSVLRYSYFAYTLYGVAITPALVAALAWKRATKWGGLASIFGGAAVAVFFELIAPVCCPGIIESGDPWGIPTVFFAFGTSLVLLVVVSLMTKPPTKEALAQIFEDEREGSTKDPEEAGPEEDDGESEKDTSDDSGSDGTKDREGKGEKDDLVPAPAASTTGGE